MLNFMLEYLADIFTIQAWRSLWHFLDLNIFKIENDDEKDIVDMKKAKSASVSLAIGVSIYIIIHILNEPINKLSSKKSLKTENENSSQTYNLINMDERENYEKHKLTLKNRFFCTLSL